MPNLSNTYNAIQYLIRHDIDSTFLRIFAFFTDCDFTIPYVVSNSTFKLTIWTIDDCNSPKTIKEYTLANGLAFDPLFNNRIIWTVSYTDLKLFYGSKICWKLVETSNANNTDLQAYGTIELINIVNGDVATADCCTNDIIINVVSFLTTSGYVVDGDGIVIVDGDGVAIIAT